MQCWVKLDDESGTYGVFSIGRGSNGAALYPNSNGSTYFSVNSVYGPSNSNQSTNWMLLHGRQLVKS